MAESISLEVEGLIQQKDRFGKMRERAHDLTPVWEQAHDAFMIEMDEQFRTEGAYFLGGGWAPLSPEYAKRKPKPPAPFGILYRSGDLYRSLATEGAGHVKRLTPTDAVMGTVDEKAKWHQVGDARLPQRKILQMRQEFKKFVVRTTMKFLVTGEAAAGA